MIDLSDNAVKSAIRDMGGPHGRTLSWEESHGQAWQTGLFRAVAGTVSLVLVSAWWVVGIQAILRGISVIEACIVVLGWLPAGWLLWYFWWPSPPERIELRPESFTYYPGRGNSRLFFLSTLYRDNPAAYRQYPGFLGLPGLFRGHRRVLVLKAVFRGFVLERQWDAERLYFEHGEIRTEIGACLSSADKHRLFDFLQQWQHDSPKPGSRQGPD